jgi:hypothetical protein
MRSSWDIALGNRLTRWADEAKKTAEESYTKAQKNYAQRCRDDRTLWRTYLATLSNRTNQHIEIEETSTTNAKKSVLERYTLSSENTALIQSYLNTLHLLTIHVTQCKKYNLAEQAKAQIKAQSNTKKPQHSTPLAYISQNR